MLEAPLHGVHTSQTALLAIPRVSTLGPGEVPAAPFSPSESNVAPHRSAAPPTRGVALSWVPTCSSCNEASPNETYRASPAAHAVPWQNANLDLLAVDCQACEVGFVMDGVSVQVSRSARGGATGSGRRTCTPRRRTCSRAPARRRLPRCAPLQSWTCTAATAMRTACWQLALWIWCADEKFTTLCGPGAKFYPSWTWHHCNMTATCSRPCGCGRLLPGERPVRHQSTGLMLCRLWRRT